MERKSFVRTAISYEDTDEWREVWKGMKMLALKDGWSLTETIREAMKEYVRRHSPGNPQLSMGHWTKNEPLPETLRHVHKWVTLDGDHGYTCEGCGKYRK